MEQVFEWGEKPLYINKIDGGYTVDPVSSAECEPVGVRDFVQGEYTIMQARALAHGYKLVINEVPAEGK